MVACADTPPTIRGGPACARPSMPCHLTEAERARLRTLIGAGVAPARMLTHARILLKANQGEGGPRLDRRGDCRGAGGPSRPRWRASAAQYVEQGLEAALERKRPDRVYARKLDGAPEARLVAVACSDAAGRARALDAAAAGRRTGAAGGGRDRLVRDGAADLKANALKPWLKEQWCIPPEANAEFVWHMEDVLDVYTRPVRSAAPAGLPGRDQPPSAGRRRARRCRSAPGRPARHDQEYERRGRGQPLPGLRAAARLAEVARQRRGARASTGRTASRTWSTSTIPTPSGSCWCMDNLNTHTPASLYEAFPPAEAKRLADKLEIHYTPKHGSWLNMAEIELSVLAAPVPRPPPAATARRWNGRSPPGSPTRNAAARTIDWRFTTDDARIKLKHLYPVFHADGATRATFRPEPRNRSRRSARRAGGASHRKDRQSGTGWSGLESRQSGPGSFGQSRSSATGRIAGLFAPRVHRAIRDQLWRDTSRRSTALPRGDRADPGPRLQHRRRGGLARSPCLGVAVHGSGGAPPFAMSMTGPSARFTLDRALAFAPAAVEIAHQLSMRLGWQPELQHYGPAQVARVTRESP